MSEIRIDALLPAEMATRAEYIGVRKSEMPALTMFSLALLAGAFISLGAVFATTVSAGGMTINAADGAAAFSTGLPYGVTRLLAGLVFCLGLILVVVGGAELFTGNNLIVMAWASRKVTTAALLRNWVIVYIGNFIGSIGTAVLVFLSAQYTFGGGAVGLTALNIAKSKVELGFVQAIALGILCNALVCLAVWMTFSARSTIDKIAAIIFPITAFVAAGFEHSIANMCTFAISMVLDDPQSVNFAGVIHNLIPVTIGNLIGGGIMMGWMYYYANKPFFED